MPKRREDLDQHQEEICSLFPQMRVNDIAIKFKTSETTIRNILRDNGIHPREIKKEEKDKELQKEFGDLSVIKEGHRTNKNHRQFWCNCKCNLSCILVEVSHLNTGVRTQCDCCKEEPRNDFNKQEKLSIISEYNKGKTLATLCQKFKTNAYQIRKILKEGKIQLRTKSESKGFPKLKKQKEICTRYNKGDSLGEIERSYKLGRVTIKKILNIHGIKIRSQSIQQGGIEIEEHHNICRRYSNGETTTQIARDYDVGYDCITSILNKNNIPIRDVRIRHLSIPVIHHEDICKSYVIGLNTYQLAKLYKVNHPNVIRKVLQAYNIEIRSSDNPTDTIEHAINGSGNFSKKRSTEYYVYGLIGYSEYIKPGISFIAKYRYKKEGNYYNKEKEYLIQEFNCREKAYFLELAILEATKEFAECPDELIKRGVAGLTEIRKMKFNKFKEFYDFYEQELDEMGEWQFAATYIPKMTKEQKEECEIRAAEEANR